MQIKLKKIIPSFCINVIFLRNFNFRLIKNNVNLYLKNRKTLKRLFSIFTKRNFSESYRKTCNQ